jgi:putative ABC transport system ATP-binding protein
MRASFVHGAILLVTHDPRWAEQAERQIALFDGKIVDDRRARAATASVESSVN